MTTTPHPEDMPEAIKAYEDRYQCSAEDPMCQADLGFFLAGWSASASLAEQRTRAMREAIVWSPAGYNKELAVDATGKVRGEVCEHSIDPRWDARANDARLGEYLNRDQAKAAVLAALSPPSAPGKGEAEGKDAAELNEATEALHRGTVEGLQHIIHRLQQDQARLDWLDATNARFKMGWEVGKAPAGNVSIRSVIQLGRALRPIREAIDAAMASHPGPLERMQKIDDEMGIEP